MKEIFYHDINSLPSYCMLTCKVTPLQGVSSKPSDVWAIVVKDAGDHPGGKIASCFCTCTAGLYWTCNHVAGYYSGWNLLL